MSIQFEYFYGDEAEQFTFYRIPKILVTSPTFKRVSDSAKLLYGLMLDRMGLSIRNGWVDDENRAYIFFTTNDVMEQMCCGTEKATKLLAELDAEKGIGLIERKKQGQGKPAIIYLKKFYISENNDRDLRLSETEIPDFRKSKVKTFENRNPRLSEVESTDFRESKPNNNKYNNTYKNNTESNLIPSMAQESEDDTIRCDEMEQYYILAETVKQNIDYDVLLQSYPNEGQLVQGIYELIVETVAYIGKKLVVASNELPAELVKNRLMKLNFMHIQYVISSMKKNTTEIKNIKKYLLAALYNAPATMQGYYQAEVNHAMPQYAKRN